MQRVSKEAVQGLLSRNEGTVFFQDGLTMLSPPPELPFMIENQEEIKVES